MWYTYFKLTFKKEDIEMTYKEMKAEFLKKPENKKEYDKLEPEYQMLKNKLKSYKYVNKEEQKEIEDILNNLTDEDLETGEIIEL